MNLNDLISQLVIDTKGSPDASFFSIAADSSLRPFLPELILCLTVLLMLLVRLFKVGRSVSASWIAIAGAAAALYFCAPWEHLGAALSADAAADPTAITRMELFTGMLVVDTFSVYVRSLLLLFAVLFVIFTSLTGIPDHEDGPDVYSLVLGSTIGMCLMASANHLLTVFMAVEMASVPSYVLAGLMKGRRTASEAALKYSVYGAGAAGVMLYGISLLAGLLHSCHLPTMALQLSEKLPTMGSSEIVVLALAGLMVGVGLAFKLSAVPFHFWCPDVFDGATAEVNAFLSIASKAAALALLVRVTLGLGMIQPESVKPGDRTAAKVAAAPAEVAMTTAGLFRVDDEVPSATPSAEAPAAEVPATDAAPAAETPPAESPATEPAVAEESPAIEEKPAIEAAPAVEQPAETPAPAPAAESAPEPAVAAEPTDETPAAADPLAGVRSFAAKLIALLAVLSCTFGNLAAYGQTNIKRLLAYSTIAHAGYMMMPVAAMLMMVGINNAGAERAVASLAVYMAVYMFMNLGAFAVIATLRNAMRSEQIADYAGLIRRCPLTVICFSLILFSLIGLPPLSGFIGKFAIFAALAEGYQSAGPVDGFFLLAVLMVGGLNTAISLFYYLRLVKVMTIDEEPKDRRPFIFSDVSISGAYLWLLTLPTVGLIINWNGLNEMAMAAARYLFA